MHDLKEEWNLQDDERYCLKEEKEIIEEECEKLMDKIEELTQNVLAVESKFDAQALKLLEIDANVKKAQQEMLEHTNDCEMRAKTTD